MTSTTPRVQASTNEHEQWHRIDGVLEQLLDHDRAQWPMLLARLCGNDLVLRAEVEQLLAYEQASGARLLDAGAGALAAQMVRDMEDDRTADALEGTQLGVWRVERQIGRGGMSRVFLGHRTDGAFEQRVAIKVLRAGLDADADFARFRIERQILASLEHPYIARLFDGGVTGDGRPYLVLEYIEGEPLTTFCASRGLDTPARLRLFLSVAEATQSAHRQLVVHRDLKPANILVGADGRPRLLDFGIAKIIDAADGAPTDATATRRRWYTPEYAAPEQFSGAPVTTATDVYQLAVVLYELLSGKRPFAGADSADALERQVREVDPPPPSRYRPALNGDLDAVILKGMRKEPLARYASVSELAADVQRVLDGEPVQARIGNRAYRWRRTLRRRAVPLAIAAVSVVATVVYLTTLVVQNRRVSRALATATVERETAEQVTAFLLGLFEAGDPRAGRTDTITVRSLLDKGDRNAAALVRAPAVRARLLDMIGSVRTNLGAFTEARPAFDSALAIRRRVLGDDHPDVAESIAHLAKLDELENRLADAERGYRDALTRQQRLLGDTAVVTQETRLNLASVLHSSGRTADATPLFVAWESVARAQGGPRDVASARQMSFVGEYLVQAARGDSTIRQRAERLFRDALAIQRRELGPVHADEARTMQQLATLLWKSGRTAEAEPLFREVVQAMRTMYPKGDALLASTLSDFGLQLVRASRPAEGLPMLREAAEMARVVHGRDDVLTGAYAMAYGNALQTAGENATAERVLREALMLLQQHGGSNAIMALRARANLGDVISLQGRHAEAERLIRDVYLELAAKRGVSDKQTQIVLRQLVGHYERSGRSGRAAEYRALLVAPASARKP